MTTRVKIQAFEGNHTLLVQELDRELNETIDHRIAPDGPAIDLLLYSGKVIRITEERSISAKQPHPDRPQLAFGARLRLWRPGHDVIDATFIGWHGEDANIAIAATADFRFHEARIVEQPALDESSFTIARRKGSVEEDA